MVGKGRPSRKRSAVAGKGEPATCCSSRRRKSALDTASHSSDDEPEVIVCTDSESGAESESQQQLPEQISTLPTRRAVRTRHEFAYRLRKVIDSIPEGRVASYGQCAALAGAPRNARQVKVAHASLKASIDRSPSWRGASASLPDTLPWCQPDALPPPAHRSATYSVRASVGAAPRGGE